VFAAAIADVIVYFEKKSLKRSHWFGYVFAATWTRHQQALTPFFQVNLCAGLLVAVVDFDFADFATPRNLRFLLNILHYPIIQNLT
jgi:hypothetical protein